MFPDITTKPHRLREKHQPPLDFSQTYHLNQSEQTNLSLLDGLCRSLFKQLDGLVVVQSPAASNHVTQELNAVQLPIRVLGSRVIHKADLRIDPLTYLETGQG